MAIMLSIGPNDQEHSNTPEPRNELRGRYPRENRQEKAERQINRRNTGAGTGTHERVRASFPHPRENPSVGDEERGWKNSRIIRTGSTRYGEFDAGSHAPSSGLRRQNLNIIATQWGPGKEGRETVTLVVKDDKEKLEDTRVTPGETRWSHICPEGNMTLEEFQDQVTRRNGLDNDDILILHTLLTMVKRKSEKTFVHGRYLKPRTFTYEAVYPEEDVQSTGKLAMFVCIPIFSLGDPKIYNTTKESSEHPVKALLQSLYRLESTVHRERKQVVAKMALSNQLQLIHVPQLWALVINRHTIITYGPLESSLLCRNTIKILTQSKAQSDEKSWLIHFTDTEDKVYYLRLRLCKTWFGLVKQVADDCLHSDDVRDRLLSAKPLLNLIADDSTIITVDSWPKTLRAKRNDIIRLKLVRNTKNVRELNRSLVTYLDDDWDKIEESDHDSEFSSTLNSDEDNASYKSSMSLKEINRLIRFATDKLRRMKARLERENFFRAPSRAKSPAQARVDDMEEQILALITKKLGLEDSELASTLEADKISYSNKSPPNAQRTDEESQESFSIHSEAAILSERTSRSQQSREDEIDDIRDRERLSSRRSISAADGQQTAFRAFGSGSSDPQLDQSYVSHEEEALRPDSQNPGNQFVRDKIRTGIRSSHFPHTDYQNDAYNMLSDTDGDVAKIYQEGTKPLNKDIAAHDTNRYPLDNTMSTKADKNTRRMIKQQQERQGRNVKRKEGEPSRKSHVSMTATDGFSTDSSAVPNADDMPIFSWPTGHNLSRSSEPTVVRTGFVTPRPTPPTLKSILEKIDTRLQDRKTSTTLQAQKAILYSEAPTRTIVDVENLLSSSKNINQKISTQKRNTFNLARKIIMAWVPYDCETSVIKKYWGAVYRLLDDRRENQAMQGEYGKPKKETIFLNETGILIAGLWDLIENIQKGVRTEDQAKHSMLKIPPALPLAFQDLILFFILISRPVDAETESWSNVRRDLYENCARQLSEGTEQLLLMVHADVYRARAGFEALDSETLLMLIIENLLAVSSTEREGEGEFHLTEMYSEYTSKIQSLVRERASVRVYDDIKLLREEIDAIKFTLTQQNDILKGLPSGTNDIGSSSNLSLHAVERMVEAVRQQMEDFDELLIQADTAQYSAAQSISLKAESNNRAILVFTVVTIIFLPLSFVTSFLGMNTSDLRTMDSNQTVFWEIALPITVLVLSSALIAAYYDRLSQMILPNFYD